MTKSIIILAYTQTNWPVYDIKRSDSKVSALEIRGMLSIPLLPLLPGPLWLRVVAPDSPLSMGQIEQTDGKLMLNCDCYIAILKSI